MAKKKKEKIIYYDDDSTIVDMDAVNRKRHRDGFGKPTNAKSKSSAKEKWETYRRAVRMMLFPLAMALTVLLVLYLLLLLLGGGA